MVEGGVFSPLAADQVVPLVRGTQGLDMVGIHLRANGSSVPDCLGQETFAFDAADAIVADLRSPLTMYGQGDGSFRTDIAWLILYPGVNVGDAVTLRTEAGGQMFEQRIFLDEMGPSAVNAGATIE